MTSLCPMRQSEGQGGDSGHSGQPRLSFMTVKAPRPLGGHGQQYTLAYSSFPSLPRAQLCAISIKIIPSPTALVIMKSVGYSFKDGQIHVMANTQKCKLLGQGHAMRWDGDGFKLPYLSFLGLEHFSRQSLEQTVSLLLKGHSPERFFRQVLRASAQCLGA